MFIINAVSGVAQWWAEFLVSHAWLTVLFFAFSVAVYIITYMSVESTLNYKALRSADGNVVHALITMVLALIGATQALAILATIGLLALLVCLGAIVIGAGFALSSEAYWRLRRR
jgi:hypothetical protein